MSLVVRALSHTFTIQFGRVVSGQLGWAVVVGAQVLLVRGGAGRRRIERGARSGGRAADAAVRVWLAGKRQRPFVGGGDGRLDTRIGSNSHGQLGSDGDIVGRGDARAAANAERTRSRIDAR